MPDDPEVDGRRMATILVAALMFADRMRAVAYGRGIAISVQANAAFDIAEAFVAEAEKRYGKIGLD